MSDSIEREILWTGIGGQGVQLAAKILALAATRDGREVMSLGTYGGTMRGGNTDATVVIATSVTMRATWMLGSRRSILPIPFASYDSSPAVSLPAPVVLTEDVTVKLTAF